MLLTAFDCKDQFKVWRSKLCEVCASQKTSKETNRMTNRIFMYFYSSELILMIFLYLYEMDVLTVWRLWTWTCPVCRPLWVLVGKVQMEIPALLEWFPFPVYAPVFPACCTWLGVLTLRPEHRTLGYIFVWLWERVLVSLGRSPTKHWISTRSSLGLLTSNQIVRSNCGLA